MGMFNKFKKKSEVLNIEKTEVLDGVASDENGTKLILLLSDGMEWHDEERHLLLLQEKLNNYIVYIESQQYLQKYPKVKDVEIALKFLYVEATNCKKFLEQVIKLLQDNMSNVSLSIEHGTVNS